MLKHFAPALVISTILSAGTPVPNISMFFMGMLGVESSSVVVWTLTRKHLYELKSK